MTTHSMKNSPWHTEMLGDLVVAGLSERTREAYLRAVRQLAASTGSGPTCPDCGGPLEFVSFYRIRPPPLEYRKESQHATTTGSI